MASTERTRIAITWQLSSVSGWGIYGIHLVLNLLKRPEMDPLLITPPTALGILNPVRRNALQPIFERSERFRAFLDQQGDASACPFPVFHALGNNLARLETPYEVVGSRNVGVVFFEDPRVIARGQSSAKDHDVIVAGSTWNAEVLRAHGIENVTVVLQGVDPTVFHVAPTSNLFADRFIVFSGGTLEYRKGQDILIAAFREFRQRHPESLLLTAWQNVNVVPMAPFDEAGHVTGAPERAADGSMRIQDWLAKNGVPPESTFDVGLLPNEALGPIVREANVGLFTNRCEGGTNLVAMETMACGVPTILSDNTGHQDLLRDGHAVALREQRAVRPPRPNVCVDGWGESRVEETIEALEHAYADPAEATTRGEAAAEAMLDWSWERQTDRLLDVLESVL